MKEELSTPSLLGIILHFASTVDFARGTKAQLREAATGLGVGRYDAKDADAIPPLASLIEKDLADGLSLLNGLEKVIQAMSYECDEMRGVVGTFGQFKHPNQPHVGQPHVGRLHQPTQKDN